MGLQDSIYIKSFHTYKIIKTDHGWALIIFDLFMFLSYIQYKYITSTSYCSFIVRCGSLLRRLQKLLQFYIWHGHRLNMTSQSNCFSPPPTSLTRCSAGCSSIWKKRGLFAQFFSALHWRQHSTTFLLIFWNT